MTNAIIGFITEKEYLLKLHEMTSMFKRYQPTQHKIKALVYGASGVGKTTFGATAPNPIFLSAEGGLLSVADKQFDYAE